MNELGYLKDYGHIILSCVLIAYGVLVTHLIQEYGLE